MELNDILSDKPSADVPQTNAEPDLKLKQDAPQTELPLEPDAPKEEGSGRSSRKEHIEKEYEAQGRNPDGTFKAKEPVAEEPNAEPKVEPKPEPAAAPVAAQPPKVEMTERERAFLATATEERRKRQALEQQLAARQQPPQQPAEAPKTFWDNPDEALTSMRNEVSNALLSTRLSTAEAIARSRHPDFDEKIAKFGEMMQTMPGLGNQMVAAPDPAEFAYRTATYKMEVDAVGSLDAYKQKVATETEARVRAQLEAEYKAKEAALAKAKAELPGTLSDARGAPQQATVWTGPTSLDAILKH